MGLFCLFGKRKRTEAMENSLKKLDSTEKGYEDIFSTVPYIDVEHDGVRCLIHMLYVPPSHRRKGVGKSLVRDLLANLSADTQVVRLKSATLGAGDTLPFWRSLGFTPVYRGNAESTRILQLAVNGHCLPDVEDVGDEEKHYIFD